MNAAWGRDGSSKLCSVCGMSGHVCYANVRVRLVAGREAQDESDVVGDDGEVKGADLLIVDQRAGLPQEELGADRTDCCEQDCNQKIQVLRRLINRLSESVQHGRKSFGSGVDAEFFRAPLVVTTLSATM